MSCVYQLEQGNDRRANYPSGQSEGIYFWCRQTRLGRDFGPSARNTFHHGESSLGRWLFVYVPVNRTA